MQHDSCMCGGMAHSHVRHGTFTCATWLHQVCVTWLMYINRSGTGMSHIWMSMGWLWLVGSLKQTAFCKRDIYFKEPSNHSHPILIPMCDITGPERYIYMSRVTRLYTWVVSHVPDGAMLHMWRCHVEHVSELYRHTYMSHDASMNESCRTQIKESLYNVWT